jgi:hypothetical protein
MAMYDFSQTDHVEALRPEHGWNNFKREKRISILENERDAPKGLSPETFREKLKAWDNATVHRTH